MRSAKNAIVLGVMVLAVVAPVLECARAQEAAPGAAGPESQQRTAAAARAAGTAAPTAAQLEARQKFLEVEAFARSAGDGQVKGLADFYRSHPLRAGISPISFLSSVPGDILDRKKSGFPGGEPQDIWAEQLQQAAAHLTPEQVADALAEPIWLNVGAYVRTVQVLKKYPKELAPVVDADLDSTQADAFERGCSAVQELSLKGFTGKILDVYLAEGPRSKTAYGTLIWLKDPAILVRLREEITRDPKSLTRHAGLFQEALDDQPADPVVMKLLSSDDADIRYYAAYALEECADAALAPTAAKLAGESDPRSQEAAAYMARKLPREAFAAISLKLQPLLKSPNAGVQSVAITAFAAQKDPAVAPILREFLAKPLASPSDVNPTILQALNALTGTTFGYSASQWGAAKNAPALARFDQWILAHRGTLNGDLP